MPSSLAALFRDLHHRRDMLFLPNAWDAASAHLQARAGAQAVGTSSAALCWALGYQDGGTLPVGELMAAIRRITRTLGVPLTVDIEDGYSNSPEAVAELAADVLGCGAAGINIEDGAGSSEVLAAKIQAIRSRTGAAQPFINARTDVYLRSLAHPGPQAVAMVAARAHTYAQAGADGLFVPGLVHGAEIGLIAAATHLPLNLMLLPGLPDGTRLALAGVRRLSAGPAMFLSAYAQLAADTAAFLQCDTADMLRRALPFSSVNGLFPAQSAPLRSHTATSIPHATR
nr:isocitrate lyase/phosphoenolpyruvate mutase family protein [uncultured Acidovorax sp.]